MPQWARVFTLLVGMLAWLAIVIVSLFLQQIPSAVVIGFPAGLWLALAGGSSIARRREGSAAEVAATDREDDAA